MSETNSRPNFKNGILLISFSGLGAVLIISLLCIAKIFGQGNLPIDPTIGSSVVSSMSNSSLSSVLPSDKNIIGPVLYEVGLSIGWSFLYGILLFLGSLVVLGFLFFLCAALFGMNRIRKGDQKWQSLLSASLLIEGFGWVVVSLFLAFVTVNYWFLALLVVGACELYFAFTDLVKNKKAKSR